MNASLGIGPALLIAACGGTVDDKRGSGNDGLGTCSDCSDPTPSPAPQDPAEPGAADAAPNDPVRPATTPTPQPNPVQAFAIFERDMPPLDSSGMTSGSSGGFPDLDPNTLHLVIGNSGASCANAREIADCGEWSLRIPLPPDLQRIGTIPLSAVYGFFSSGDEPRSSEPFDCAMGAGSFSEGSLTIHELSEARVVLSLSDTWAFVGDVDVNGRYDADVCTGD